MKKILFVLVSLVTFLSCGSDKLVVYTNSGSNGRQEFLEQYAKENGFDIAVVSAGGTDTSNRLNAEKDKPLADVVFGLNAIEYEKLKKFDLFEKYEPSWAKDIPAGLSDPEGYYNAVTVTPLLAVYNKDKTPAVPTDWVELATSETFKDKYSIFALTGGTGKAVFASIVSRYKDPNGDLGISAEGWEVAKQYFANAHIIQGDEDYYSKLMDGTYPILMLWASGAIERSQKFGFDYGIMKPEIGVPVVVEQLAILKASKRKETAEKFVEWLGSPEVQAVWAEKFGTIPAHPEALAKAPQANQDLYKQIKVQDMDWKFIAENVDSWVEKATLQYIK